VVLALNENERQFSLGNGIESNLFVLVLNLLKFMEERLMCLPEGRHKLKKFCLLLNWVILFNPTCSF
jgi:hypothetical protein